MTYGHLGIIKDQGGPLAGLIEAGCGFRFRNREQEFTLVEETLSGWTFRDESGSLEVQVRLRVYTCHHPALFQILRRTLQVELLTDFQRAGCMDGLGLSLRGWNDAQC